MGVYMNLGIQIALAQKQQISQAQIQSLEILSMDNIEIQELLQNEYIENPLMEYTANSSDVVDVEKINSMYQTMPAIGGSLERKEEQDISRERVLTGYREERIKEYLTSQLERNRYTQEQWSTFEYLIDCLDEHGFFSLDLTEISVQLGYKLEIVERCLEELRELEPYGIFAEDTRNCLLKQLEVVGKKQAPIWYIVKEHMEDIATGKISNISRSLKLPTIQVRKYIAEISKLNPRPLNGFTQIPIAFIVPDIIVTLEEDRWQVELNDNWVRDYKTNDYYYRMMQKSKEGEMYEYFKKKLERIYFIMDNIEQRRKTLIQITKIILDKQGDFFRKGEPLKLMTMVEIAQELDVHASTISRAIRGKYIQYPGGNILMKSLFSCASFKQISDKEEMTPILIKEKIKEIVLGECKQNPYSDIDLAKKLEEYNISVSRRTVAKYRQELGIKGSFDRKEFI